MATVQFQYLAFFSSASLIFFLTFCSTLCCTVEVVVAMGQSPVKQSNQEERGAEVYLQRKFNPNGKLEKKEWLREKS